jgi:hypothetical protein
MSEETVILNLTISKYIELLKCYDQKYKRDEKSREYYYKSGKAVNGKYKSKEYSPPVPDAWSKETMDKFIITVFK